jgi:hypothetical protein
LKLILPQEGDYNILHDEMEHEGFTRTIIGDDGDEYHLPDAEYNKIGEFNKSDIMAAAKRAANNTARHFRILITEEIGGRSWYKKLVALNKKVPPKQD